MNDFTSLLQQGNAWLFIPSAILLGLPTCVVSNACQHTMILFISRFIYWGVVFYYWGGVG
ncbi:hypothetical protein A7K92_26755 [Klebsiella pneumoniae]|nr:hypothetical protein A7K92_26755 [Klebsiella pneumoniae]